MRIYNNIMAINAYRNVSLRYNALMRSMERLSSGLRINRAADDPAGLAISERMRAQIRGLKQASRNAQDAISMLQVAEGALNQTSAILQRIRELTVQAATGTNSESDLEAIQLEIEQLLDELNRIAGDTNFNTIPLLNSQSESKQPSSATFRIQIGANSGQYMEISLANMGAAALGIAEIDVTKDADGALSLVEQAIKMAASERGKIGDRKSVV